jgi:hypothetical protein
MMDAEALAALRQALIEARDAHPELRRGAGQLLPAIEVLLGLPAETPRQERPQARVGISGRGARRRG